MTASTRGTDCPRTGVSIGGFEPEIRSMNRKGKGNYFSLKLEESHAKAKGFWHRLRRSSRPRATVKKLTVVDGKRAK